MELLIEEEERNRKKEESSSLCLAKERNEGESVKVKRVMGDWLLMIWKKGKRRRKKEDGLE